MASPSLLCFLSLLSLFPPSISSSPTTIPIPLSHFTTNPSPDPYQKLSHLAAISLTRAHHIKNPQNVSLSKTPLFSHSYGGYSISLSFGTPPQTIPFIMDTGSDFVWFPCTHRYFCKNCSFSGSNPSTISPFIPKLSSSSRLLGCLNPKCSWIHNPDVESRCRDCEPNSRNCTQICPPYIIMYGSGDTGGVAMVETLNLPGGERNSDFVVGCSLFSSNQPAGIAGFGRGPPSLPSQLGLKKFSYCLLSHKFDDSGDSSSLVLDHFGSGEKTENVSYTPLIKNPIIAGKRAYSVYYYVALRKITVGAEHVKIPYKYLSPGTNGDGGTIVDSGTTFTYMSNNVFELVLGSFINQVKNYKRALDVESLIGLRPCFNISGEKPLSLPEMRFHFKGGAEMVLPLANYFSIAGDSGAVCLTVVSDGAFGSVSSGGPAIILGNYQMQNYYVEFDLRNERFGFRHQSCK